MGAAVYLKLFSDLREKLLLQLEVHDGAFIEFGVLFVFWRVILVVEFC